MFNGIFHIPQPTNEPCLQYGPGSPERAESKAKLKEMLGQQVDVPMIIGGEVSCFLGSGEGIILWSAVNS